MRCAVLSSYMLAGQKRPHKTASALVPVTYTERDEALRITRARRALLMTIGTHCHRIIA
jgi:hypothetical protein